MVLDLNQFNPWWQTGEVPPALLGKERRLLRNIIKDLDLRQIQVLSGIRRSGKTTLLFQIVNWLLRKQAIEPLTILYFSFDAEIENIDEIIESYERLVLKGSIKDRDKVYCLFDEVQKLNGWPDKIKRLYDMNPNIKFLLSGSAAIHLRHGTRESLAGRFFDVSVKPLAFDEYLDFLGTKIDMDHEEIYEGQLRRSFDDYLRSGGFIETFGFDDDTRLRYFRESLLERVVYMDLPATYSVRSPDLLFRMIKVIAERPGMYLEYRNLGNDLGFDQRTIAEYLNYLENALLVQRVYNYSPTQLTSEKKIKRAYLTSTAFSLTLAPVLDQGLLIEQYFINDLDARFFWRSPQKDEVDLIAVTSDRSIPIEIKIRKTFKKSYAAPVFKFMKRYNVEKGFLISDSVETVLSDGKYTVNVIPYWKHRTLKEKILLG